MKKRTLQLAFSLVALCGVLAAAQISSTMPDTSQTSSDDARCYMPAPDVEPSSTGPTTTASTSRKPAQGKRGAKAVTAAEPANNLANKITVDVSKPFPQCAADISSIDPKRPQLSTGIDGDSEAKIGSPECLLAGVANSNFNNCAKTSGTGTLRAEASKERVDLDYAIINLVKWSSRTKKPEKNSWYLYDRKSRTTVNWNVSKGLRMMGSANVGFLAVHFGIDDTCGIQYTVEAKQKTPTNIADLQQLYQLAKTVAPSVFPDIPSITPKDITASDTANALNSVMSPATKQRFADKVASTSSNEKLKDILKAIESQSMYTADVQALGPMTESTANPRSHVRSAIRTIPDAPDIIVSESAKQNENPAVPFPVPIPTKAIPGVGIYGYASFKGIEQLPYDLTLTGRPSGTPALASDPIRYAKTLATQNALPIPSTVSLARRDKTEPVAVSWSKDDAPLTCPHSQPTPVAEVSSPRVARSEDDSDSQSHSAPNSKDGAAFGHLYSPAVARIPTANTGIEPPQADSGDKPAKKGPSKPDQDQAKTPQADDQLTSKQVYSNEGLYKWDVSIGVTAFTAQKTSFTASDGSVHKSTSRPENIYVFGDYFPWKTDLVNPPAFRWKPSLSGGIPAGNQPFNRPVVGTSFGFKIAGFRVSPFVGVLFLREFRPKASAIGEKSTDAQLKSDLVAHHNYRLFVSVNFSIKDAANLIKNKGTAQSADKSKSNKSKSGNSKSGATSGGGN